MRKKTLESVSNGPDYVEQVRNFIELSRENHQSDSTIMDTIMKMEIPEEKMEDIIFLIDKYEIREDDLIPDKTSRKSDEDGIDSINCLQSYLKEIGAIRLLTREEEIELAKKAENGDVEARNKMVEHNLKLVVSIARRYHSSTMTLDDLIQEGNIGLMKALEKYDYRLGYKFSTYATWWIRQSVTRAISDQSRTIRIPVHMVETINKLNKAKIKLSNELNREPTLEELSKELGIPVRKIKEISEYGISPVSLDTPIGEDGESNLSDFIEDDKFENAQEKLEKEELANRVVEMLDTLSARESNVLKMRYGIGYSRSYTLEEIGNKYGITRERIRQIEARAMKRLKEDNKQSILYGYTDDYDIKNPYI